MVSRTVPVSSAAAPAASPRPALGWRGALGRAALIVLALTVLLLIVYFAVVRPWHMRWGATDAELAMSLPSDPDLPANAAVSTRAITIHATPEQIWPWIAQIGQGRAGWYSHAWIENLIGAGMHNSDAILPQFQDVKPGDELPFTEGGTGSFAAHVTQVEPERYLAMQGWILYLEPIDAENTRLIVRYPWPLEDDFGSRFFYYMVAEPIHFVMESGMMLGIKQRAETYGGA